MIFYLLVCSSVYGGWNCLPPQRMESLEVCRFIASHYKDMTGDYIHTRCVTIRGKR